MSTFSLLLFYLCTLRLISWHKYISWFPTHINRVFTNWYHTQLSNKPIRIKNFFLVFVTRRVRHSSNLRIQKSACKKLTSVVPEHFPVNRRNLKRHGRRDKLDRWRAAWRSKPRRQPNVDCKHAPSLLAFSFDVARCHHISRYFNCLNLVLLVPRCDLWL